MKKIKMNEKELRESYANTTMSMQEIKKIVKDNDPIIYTCRIYEGKNKKYVEIGFCNTAMRIEVSNPQDVHGNGIDLFDVSKKTYPAAEFRKKIEKQYEEEQVALKATTITTIDEAIEVLMLKFGYLKWMAEYQFEEAVKLYESQGLSKEDAIKKEIEKCNEYKPHDFNRFL